MNRGISFKIPNVYDKVLSRILRGMEFELYSWRISEDEVFRSMKEGNGYLFVDKIFEGEAFKKEIESEPYLPRFINVQVYPIGIASTEIKSYVDFEKSGCDFIILIWDCIYVDVYAKSSDIIELIKNNAEQEEFDDIEHITEENDCRTRMSVW